MGEMKRSVQVAVVGGGPGGYVAAFHAAELGLEVALIDPEANPGGVCLFRGCIPSKALLHVARVIREAQQARQWGVMFPRPNLALDQMRAWKESVVTKLTGGLGQLTKQRGITYIKGTARFIDARTLEVRDNGEGERVEQLAFDNAIVATGSQPARLAHLNFDSPRILDSTSALELEDIPQSLLVIGGGYIGLELGTVYAALGSDVSVVEMTGGLLPGVDRDLVAVLEKRLRSEFVGVLTNTTVAHVEEHDTGIEVAFDGEQAPAEPQSFEKVLVAVGRKPASGGCGLENTKVQVNERGFIAIDEQRRTREPTIYAIGDVAGQPLLAHKASHEGRVAAEAIAGRETAFQAQAIPAVVFTDPEVAWCGLTETEATEHERPVAVAKFPWAASGRAVTLGRTDGLTKLVIDPEKERILGVGIVGPGAAELIAEGVLAVEMAALASDVRLSIHPHPTLSETVMEAADVFFGESPHYRTRRRT
jgi:dihydrolipoamide dehydrogenase